MVKSNNQIQRVNLTVLENMLEKTHRPLATIETTIGGDLKHGIDPVIAPLNVLIDSSFSAVTGAGYKATVALYENRKFAGDAEFDVTTREVMFTLIRTLRSWRRVLSMAKPMLEEIMRIDDNPSGNPLNLSPALARVIVAIFENTVGNILDDPENIDKCDYLFSSGLVPRPKPENPDADI